MIEVKMNLPGGELHTGTIENQELIKGILAMPDNEYIEVIAGIVLRERVNTERILFLFARFGNLLKKAELDPSQLSVLKVYIDVLKAELNGKTK